MTTGLIYETMSMDTTIKFTADGLSTMQREKNAGIFASPTKRRYMDIAEVPA